MCDPNICAAGDRIGVVGPGGAGSLPSSPEERSPPGDTDPTRLGYAVSCGYFVRKRHRAIASLAAGAATGPA